MTGNSPPEPSRLCPRCGRPLASKAKFCRGCGAPIAAKPPRMPPPPPKAPPPAAPGPAAQPPPLPATPSRRGRVALALSAVVLLAGAGAAAAIALSSGSDSPAGEAQPAASSEASEAAPAGAGEGGERESPSTVEAEPEDGSGLTPAGVPAVGRARLNQEIESVLRSYHEDVVERHFRAAWSLLSARKHRQDLSEYGYRTWARAQATLTPYLIPYGLTTSIEALEGEGVARVDVTGMTWTQPGAPCAEWSGITWMKYEGGRWTYDPGYSTTGARRRAWGSRGTELLGGSC